MSRAKELTRLLHMSADSIDGNPDRSHINGLEHSLRVATLAQRYSDNDTELVFMALVHDLARPLSDPFHGEVIAEIVRDMVSETSYHVLRTHGEYQAQYIHGTPVNDEAAWHKWSQALCAWEIGSFVKEWTVPLMSVEEAVDLIDLICAGRN